MFQIFCLQQRSLILIIVALNGNKGGTGSHRPGEGDAVIQRARVFYLSVAYLSMLLLAAVDMHAQPASKPYGLSERVDWTTSRIVGTPDPPSPFRTRRAYPNLKFHGPVFIAEEPGTDRMFVVQFHGKILTFNKHDQDVAWADIFLDQHRLIYAMSFHPNYEENRYVYVFSARDPHEKEPRKSRIARFETSRDHPRCAQLDTETAIIEWPEGGHNGGEAIFGPDGYMYIATGDGTPDSDTKQTGQGVDDLLAVVMRIDVNNPAEGRLYSVPKDNPFVDVPGARPEIWAFGFRNPWRISFDADGRLWMGDVGQDLWEMIRLVERGGNYGWSVQEGTHPFYPNRKRGPGPILPPVVEHHHTDCRSITGGYVYYGDQFPELEGVYIYGDYQYGKIWGVRHDGETVVSHEELANTPLNPSTFALTSAGDMLIADYDSGEIHALERTPEESKTDVFPRKLSETGIFASVEDHRVSPGVIPYSVNAPGWANGAHAERFLALAPSSKIAGTAQDSAASWGFQDGTVTVQTMSLDMKAGDPSSRRRIETRVVVKQQNHWLGYTYLWNEEQTDAALVDSDGEDLTFTLVDSSAPGGTKQTLWRVPSRTECMTCHSRARGFVLGLNLLQMNRDHDYGEVVDNQLRTWSHLGLFESDWSKPSEELEALVNPYDDSADLDKRVHAYLDVNCSVCHVNAGGGNAQMDLLIRPRLDSDDRTVAEYDAAMRKGLNLFDVKPLHNTFGLENPRLVSPGDPYSSVLLYRLSTLGAGRMPRINAITAIDTSALDLLHEWITRVGPDGKLVDSPQDSLSETEKKTLQRLQNAAGDSATEIYQDAIDLLLASPRGAMILARAVADGSLSSEVSDVAINSALQQTDSRVRDLFERFVPPEKRTKRLGESIDPTALLAIDGDAEDGRESFLRGVGAQCKGCHRINGIGNTVGPDLSEISKKYQNRAKLLESILAPSKEVEPKFQAYLLVATSGEIVTGKLVEKTPKAVVVQDAKGEVIRFAAHEVAQLQPQTTSLMPDGLFREWTAQQAADMLAYLAMLKGE